MSNEKLFIKDLANLGAIDSFLDWHMQIELIALYECYPNFEKSFNFTNHKRREMQVKDTHNEVSSHTH